ncbi:MAG TPA: hypothetical protein PK385_09635 [Spirochaetota bacterium]|nr:hypothetical protein [Spirochaetota bacterium]HOS31722.1 hypothetical protein [Spirochaetota bacterium]HOS56306.1 hypothetical protein [Spirochaetota bacterium]HPK62603.1 hypothetical protein [Spirochaetota bacterium]HQF78763.1 hypothetical protein [Spirochaetota bacterium]
MKLKYFIIQLVIFIIIQGCGYVDLKNKNLIEPTFKSEKSMVMVQSVFEFIPSFNVFTTKYGVFFSPEDKIDGTLFKITKKASLFEDIYIINDVKKNEKLYFSNGAPDNFDRKTFKIYNDNTDLAVIYQKFKENYESFKLSYKQTDYDLTVDIKKNVGNTIDSVVLTVASDAGVLFNVFKRQLYFRNNYNMIVNEDLNVFDDSIIASVSVFFDYVLKENGISYKD